MISDEQERLLIDFVYLKPGIARELIPYEAL